MNKKHVYVVSDSLGETAQVVVRAAVSQFNPSESEIKRIPYINDFESIDELLEEAQRFQSIIVYTMVVEDLKNYLEKRANEIEIPTVDLMGPLIDGLGKLYGDQPVRTPGLLHKLDEDYFKKIEAVEFAVKYDDGKDPRAVLYADVILVGVSRTSKTPLCMYLAHKGLKAVNIPIVPEVGPPDELFKVKKGKIIGLTIKPQLLNEIREERLKTMGLGNDADYASLSRILEELEYSQNIMKKLRCPVLDVTHKAVEETASRILQIYYRGDRSGN